MTKSTLAKHQQLTSPPIHFSKLKCVEHIRIFLILKVNFYVNCLFGHSYSGCFRKALTALRISCNFTLCLKLMRQMERELVEQARLLDCDWLNGESERVCGVSELGDGLR